MARRRRLRLGVLWALLPVACVRPDGQAQLREALESGQASLRALGPPAMAAPVAVPVAAALPAAPLAAGPAASAGRPRAAAELLGAGPEALRRWLGEPALRRAEGTAEVWLYTGDSCALDLVLYPEAGALRVAHAAARAAGTEPRTEAACLGAVAAARGRS